MNVVELGTYKTENGYVVTVTKTCLPYYKFKAFKVTDEYGNECTLSEVWTEEGKAYHNDCGFNFIEQIS